MFKLKSLNGNTALVVVIILLLVLAGLIYFLAQQPVTQETLPAEEKNGATMEENLEQAVLQVVYNPAEGFNAADSVSLNEDEDATRVVIRYNDGSQVPQPAHIHEGSCENLGGVKYALSDVVGGVSETLVPVLLSELQAGLPLAVNVHKSAEEVDVYLACGDLPGIDAAMEEGEATEEAAGAAEQVAKGEETAKTEQEELKTFNISGKSFEFSRKEIRVKQGDKVRIVFTSESGFHDWVIDGLDARTKQVNTGEISEVEFVADQKGTFEYYCSVGQHRQFGMVGQLIVE